MSAPLTTSVEAAGRRSVWRAVPEAGALSAYVEASWEGVGGWARSIRLLPDGCADIVWDGRRLCVVAPQRRAVRRTVGARTRNVGLRLRCGQAGVLLGAAPGRLGSLDVPLAGLWGRLATSGEARLRRARGFGEEREILLDLVAQRLADAGAWEAPPMDMIEAIRSEDRLPYGAAGKAGWTDRDLRRAFERHVGLSPKALQRVFRFRRLLGRLAEPSPAAGGAARLAAELGYADQAHMIRDCRAICGSTPGELSRRLGG